ncbi:MAG: hypothetical protein ABSD73_08070 [Candidatus Bathyarchaeia archaeon]
MADEDTKGVRCPFCGAPYRKLIPTDALQLKCDYCGATFRTPPSIGVEIPECANHPERYATGVCNDCGQNFCRECLHPYNLNTKSDRAVLYLCPDCYKKRYLDRANGHVLSGMLIIAMGAFFTFLALPFVFVAVIGLIQVFYGVSQRSEASQELGTGQQGAETEKAAEPSGTEEADAETLYNELLTKYAEHWGVQSGAELLNNEIRAYTWAGVSFSEAVNKVYERQQKKP